VDLCVTLTPENEKDLRRIDPNLPAFNCLSNGVDLDSFSYQPPGPEAAGVCFVGKLDYQPNEDAILYFHDQIWPLISKEHPAATFFVVGSNPSGSVQALARDPSVEVTGFVQDVRPYLRRAGIAVVPVRMGGGILNKVIEAMAMGVPVITRTIGTHGLAAKPGRDLLVCDEVEYFGREVNRLLRDQGARRRLAENGRRYVESHHEWCSIVKRYEDELGSRLLAQSKEQ
jgi:glycosyltransferase involved in cell wall biosynthesis